MKIVKLFSSVLFVSVMMVSSVFAAENESAKAVKAAEKSVREQIASVLSDLSTNEKGEVSISFKLSSEKGFELIKTEGAGYFLTTAVEAALRTSLIEVPAVLQGNYTLKVRFSDKAEIGKSITDATKVKPEARS